MTRADAPGSPQAKAAQPAQEKSPGAAAANAAAVPPPRPEPPAVAAEANGTDAGLVRLIRGNLLFLLGLTPTVIAMVKIYVMAQGDTGTVLTLVRTLDPQTLVLGTFLRPIGLYGSAASGYLAVRLYGPAVRSWFAGRNTRDSADAVSAPGAVAPQPGVAPQPNWLMFWVLVMIFAVSFLSLYPEQFLDADLWRGARLWWPADLVRAYVWVGLIWAAVRYARRRLAPAAARRGRSSWPEVFIIAPVVLVLFWNTIGANERMWLPDEIITVSGPPPPGLLVPFSTKTLHTSDPCSAKATPGGLPICNDAITFRTKAGTIISGFILSASDGDDTILTEAGGVFIVPAGRVVSRLICQDFEGRDISQDTPLFTHIPGFHRLPPAMQSPQCGAVLTQLWRHR